MKNSGLNTINLLFDLIIIFAPFMLLFDGGLENFIIIFYFVYIPSLIISVIGSKTKKKDPLFKKSISLKNRVNKKEKEKELTISP